MVNVPQTTRTRTPAAIRAVIDRALAKAREQARANNVPALLSSEVAADATRQRWAVSSRTVAGTVYLVDLTADADGVSTLCQCEAQHAGRLCWHRAAARLAMFREIGHHDARGWRHGGPEDLADLMGWWSRQEPPADRFAEPDVFDPADWTEVA